MGNLENIHLHLALFVYNLQLKHNQVYNIYLVITPPNQFLPWCTLMLFTECTLAQVSDLIPT